jgi:hypothetical protein
MSRADEGVGDIIDIVAGSACRRRAEHLGSRSGQGEPEGQKRATKQFDGDLKDIDKAIQNTAMNAESLPF